MDETIMLNEWFVDVQNGTHMGEGYVRNTENECILYNWFEQMPVKPKIISFNDAKEYGIVKSTTRWKDTTMSILDAYGWSWLEEGPLDIPNATTHQEWNEWMGVHEKNMYFHANKIQWLVDIIQNEGLYSVPQAYLFKETWFCHPGQFRVYAIEYTDCNEEFVVWDVKEKLNEPEISFDEWYDLYNHHMDKALFAVKVGNNRIEMHVGEEREDLYKIIKGSHKAFGGKKPILQGTCAEEIKHLFDVGTYEGHGVGLEGHIEITDLRDMLDFHPSKQLIEKENFTLYNNYHK